MFNEYDYNNMIVNSMKYGYVKYRSNKNSFRRSSENDVIIFNIFLKR